MVTFSAIWMEYYLRKHLLSRENSFAEARFSMLQWHRNQD